MKQRLDEVGGTLQVESTPSVGTTIMAAVKLIPVTK
jgi:signal transduction histidine kinase